MKSQSGFTLVEIAIVLIVIGLLLGSVLKGQELVLSSQIHNTISEFDNIEAAYSIYRDRYKQIPGDDPTAANRWSETQAISGDGNRHIDGTWNDHNGDSETSLFWHHLRNDGLIKGARNATQTTTFELPQNPFDGDIGIQEGAFAGALLGSVVCLSNVPGKAAQIIDARLDDDPGDGSGGTSGSIQGDNSGDITDTSDQYQHNKHYLLCKQF